MKVKAPSKRPTRSNINTSTKSTKRGGRSTTSRRNRDEDDRRGRKPVKKQDNTKLFIGIGVGVFFLLIIIIAAANSGGSTARAVSSKETSSKKKEFLLPINDRKKIYSEYVKAAEQYDRERAAAMDAIGSPDERRKKGPQLVREQKTKENNLRVRLSEKYRKKYPKASSTFVKKIVSEGDKKGWR